MITVAILAWLAANPWITAPIFIVGGTVVYWFVSMYWFILLPLLLLWVVPKVLEILRGVGIDFRKTEPLVQWMDGKKKVPQDDLMDALDMLKKGIRRMGSTFVQKDANTFVKKHEMLVDLGNDQGALITREETLRRDEVPRKILDEILRHRLDSFTVNDYDVIDQKVKQRAEEENMHQLMEMVC